MQILTGVPTPISPLSVGGPGPLSNTMWLGTTKVSLPNGISFRPMALAWCTNVTHGQTVHATVTSVAKKAQSLSAMRCMSINQSINQCFISGDKAHNLHVLTETINMQSARQIRLANRALYKCIYLLTMSNSPACYVTNLWQRSWGSIASHWNLRCVTRDDTGQGQDHQQQEITAPLDSWWRHCNSDCTDAGTFTRSIMLSVISESAPIHIQYTSGMK